jgi:putative multiple sugar transport system ATP-binding protein
MIRLMVGRDITNIYPPSIEHQIGDVIMEVDGWTVVSPSTDREILHDISFNVRAGEVLGFAGLMGAGRTELALSIFGNTPAYRIVRGQVRLQGEEVSLHSAREAIDHGLAYLTEDRKGNGLILIQDVKFNMSIANLDRLANGLRLDSDKEVRLMQDLSDSIDIKTPSIEQKVLNLSGGNQQKVVIGKWLFSNPDILFLDEPTRGIDVGAKYEIYQLIRQMAADGKSVVLISSELPEILNLCDRMYVMSAGRIAGELESHEATDVKVMELATRY